MADELTRRAGKYWVLFFQPFPEGGERIAIALVFRDEMGSALVEYDPTFAKTAKLYPDTDLRGLEFYLENLRAEVSSSIQIEAVLNSYGPQISASEPRRIAAPLKRSAVKMLMARYVYPTKKSRRARGEDPVGREIEAFVRNSVGPDHEWRTDVAAREILGRSIAGTKRVAIAIQSRSGWTLVDGVDLNQLTPQEAASRADEVSRTFWNYSRVSGDSVRIRRVGVVLNGNSHLASKTAEAHDYALHRFQVDSDLAIDAVSAESGPRLKRLLEEADVR